MGGLRFSSWLAGLAVALREVLSESGGRRGDDQSDGDHELLHGSYPFRVRVRGRALAAHVAVGESVGEDRRGRGDDQGDGEDELLHGGSPFVIDIGRLISRSTGWPVVPFE